jgi:tungstate transport system substrate-binding protein
MRIHLFSSFAFLLVCALLISACAPAPTPEPTPVPPAAHTAAPTAAPTEKPAPANSELILATTTSTQDSGLLDVLIPMFTEQTGYIVKTVAVGSGQALQMGQEGNADVLFIHSPSAEKALMTDGFGKERFLVMHNYFMIVGPASDPAGISGAADGNEAMTKIHEAGAPFASRGDESGTHSKELSLWKAAGLDPATEKPAWYTETGQGMGATLTIASEKRIVYTDGTAARSWRPRRIWIWRFHADDPALINVYHVITVNPGKVGLVNHEALRFLPSGSLIPQFRK